MCAILCHVIRIANYVTNLRDQVYLSIYLSVCLSVCLSIYLSIYLSRLDIQGWATKLALALRPLMIYCASPLGMYLYLSIYLSVCLSVCICLYLSIYLSVHPSVYLWLYSPCGPWRLFHFLICTQSVGLLGQGSAVARPLPTYRTTQTQYKRTQTSMSRVGCEPTIPSCLKPGIDCSRLPPEAVFVALPRKVDTMLPRAAERTLSHANLALSSQIGAVFSVLCSFS
jgi:hypothetical protein